jgi:hypothetical protein
MRRAKGAPPRLKPEPFLIGFMRGLKPRLLRFEFFRSLLKGPAPSVPIMAWRH